MSAEELRKITEEKRKQLGGNFWCEIKDKLFSCLKEEAELGKSEYNINKHGKLNLDNWLSEPHLYNSVIKELEMLGFQVSHSDDVRDGTYLLIRW